MKEKLSFPANNLSVEEIEKNHHILDRNRKAYIFNRGSGDLIDGVCFVVLTRCSPGPNPIKIFSA